MSVSKEDSYSAIYMREWRLKNPDYQKKWRKRKQKEILAYTRAYYKKYPERRRNQGRRWAEKHPEAAKARIKLAGGRRRARLRNVKVESVNRIDIANWESRICGICELPIIELYNYHIDHIVPISKGGSHTVENLQLAHPFCNWSKRNKLNYSLARKPL